MKCPVVHYALALLLVWAFANDAWAVATGEPSDEAMASSDNVYVSANHDAGRTARHSRFGAIPASAGAAPRFSDSPVPALIRQARFGLFKLVYVFMSLRR